MFISGTSMKLINQSMNMIYDITDSVEKTNTMQQLHPMTDFATAVLDLEKNPEILDNMARYVGCSMEPRALESSQILHNKANELRSQIYEKVTSKIRENLKQDEVLQQYYQFNSSNEIEKAKQR